MNNMKIFIDGIEYDLVPKSSPDKINERDWEIESYITDYLGMSGEIFIRTSGDEFKTTISQRWNTVKESALIHNKAKIHSVKRISDGVVFSVGDEVDSTWGKQIITDFEIYKDVSMIVGFKTCKNPLEKIRKLPERTKLFTTEDGVDVFEGGEYWYLPTTRAADSFKPYKCTYASKGEATPMTWLYFSTEEKAKEYITLNKPVLSLNDILEVWYSGEDIKRQHLSHSSVFYRDSVKNEHPLFKRFEKLAKSKL